MGIGLELQTKSRHLVNEHPQYIQHRMARSYQRISRTWSCRAGALDANKLRHIDEAIEQKQLNKQHIMNFTIPNPTIALASVAILFSACGKTDTEQLQIQIHLQMQTGKQNSIVRVPCWDNIMNFVMDQESTSRKYTAKYAMINHCGPVESSYPMIRQQNIEEISSIGR